MNIIGVDIQTGTKIYNLYSEVLVYGVSAGWVKIEDRFAWERGDLSDDAIVNLARMTPQRPGNSRGYRDSEIDYTMED